MGCTPYLLYILAFLLIGSDRNDGFLDVEDQFFFVCSLSLNPIIYGFSGRKFRERLKRMLFCWKPITQNDAFELNN